MTTYKIRVRVRTYQSHEYFLLNEPPKARPGQGRGFPTVWMSTPALHGPNGQAVFMPTMDVSAVCGTLSQPLAHGMSVDQTDAVPVNVAGEQGEPPGTVAHMTIIDDKPVFRKLFGQTRTVKSFGIETVQWSTDQYPDAFWYGLGRVDPKSGGFIPVVSYPALPNKEYLILPVTAFRIGTGPYKPGMTVDFKQLEGETVVVDFTKAAPDQFLATIEHREDNTFSEPVFSNPNS